MNSHAINRDQRENLPSARAVSEYLAYDPETGVFTWKRRTKNGKAVVGAVAGSLAKDGYWQIGVLGRTHTAQRLAWLLTYGEWPEHEVDHADGVRLNNRVSNLRKCTHSQNLQNREKWSPTAGAYRTDGRWRAGIKVDGRYIYLGRHETAEAAHTAYVNAKKALHLFAPELREPDERAA